MVHRFRDLVKFRLSSAERRSKSAYRAVSDLPDVLPVTEAELDLLETGLADFFDGLLNSEDDGPPG